MSFQPTNDIRLTASEFNKRNGWDINAAIELAQEVLTDTNAHQERRYLDNGEEMWAVLMKVYEDMCPYEARDQDEEEIYDRVADVIRKVKPNYDEPDL